VASIILPDRFSGSLAGIKRLNPDHELTRLLKSAWVPSGFFPIDLVNNISDFTKYGTIDLSAGAWKGNGSSGYLSRSCSINAVYPQLLLTIHRETDANATTRYEYSFGTTATSTGAFISISSGANIGSSIRVVDGSSNAHNATGPAPVAGKIYACAWHVANASASGNYLYVNGKRYQATTANGNLESSGTSTLVYETIGALRRGTLAGYSNDNIIFAARGNPKEDVSQLLYAWTDNPREILKPRKQVIYSFGSSFPTLTSLGVSAITSSGGRLTASA
jgi:hypothetical protein